MKQCPKCKETKSLSEFHRNRSKKDKYNIHCKECRVISSMWGSMKNRCYSPNHPYFKNYGGRGITICKEWRENFQVFYNWTTKNGYKKELTIDRRNNNGNYTPENCRFVTHTVNIRNRPSTKLNIKKVKMIRKLLAQGNLLQREIAKIFNIGKTTISKINLGKRWIEIKRGGLMEQDKLYSVDELRELEGLARQTRKTLEQITEQMRTPSIEPFESEPIELEYMPEGISLD